MVRFATLLTAGLIGSLGLSACSGSSSEGAGDDWLESVHTFMNQEIDPAADGIWGAAGYIITEAGEQSLFPTTDEGWDGVIESADRLIALSAELEATKYSRDETDWIVYAQGLAAASEQVKTAANERDEEAVFEAGGLLYRVCLSCHERYRAPEGADAP